MAQVDSTMNSIKGFILQEFLPGEDPATLTPTTPLMSSGILDSLATLKLITFLEDEFNIEVHAQEADQEHFNTLQAICSLVDSKRR
jgi:acyl carrier protein